MKNNEVLKACLKACRCWICGLQADKKDYDIGSLWEKLLGSGSWKLVSATMCEKVERPECIITGSKAPNFWKRECVNGTCHDCGISKKLPILCCPAVTGCDEKVPTKVWADAERNGKNKNGKQNVQKEVTATTLPVKDILGHLVKTLEEDCHQHFANWALLYHQRICDLMCSGPDTLVLCHDYTANPSIKHQKLQPPPKTTTQSWSFSQSHIHFMISKSNWKMEQPKQSRHQQLSMIFWTNQEQGEKE